ncbi:MAG: 3-oxoacyl-ACP synthase [Bacteroides sp. SM23_62_1]|nr:MAG: 3-oxoacyl-ACP synthase [Bacteroides sp. SM23_62_1]
MEFRRVVVTGLGAVTPLGNNIKEYWEGLKNGVSGCDWITHFDPVNHKTKFACEVKNFDPTQYFDRKEIRTLDLFTLYALVTAEQAVADADLLSANLDVNRVGVLWSSGVGGLKTFQEELDDYFQGGRIPRFSPFFIPKMIPDIAAGHISIKYGFRGPNYSTVSACASSSHSIIDAMTYIRIGWADVIIVGGSESAIIESGIGGFNAMRALSQNNEEYKTASRPFDKTRDGFVMGEGGGGLIIEEYEHARRRGAKIYAEIAGAGMSADAHHLTAPHPGGIGARIVMENALRDAGMKPEDIDYINVHGTATPRGDISEAIAIRDVFGEHANKLNISATKSMTGHLLGAAGAIEAIATILAINNDIIPPTINFKVQDPEIDEKLNITPNKAQKRSVRTGLSNTFGFGGHNTSVIFKEIS